MTLFDDPLRLSLTVGKKSPLGEFLPRSATATSPSMRLRAEGGERGDQPRERPDQGAPVPVRQRLRQATAQIHEALHHAAPFARIADGTMDRTGYGDVLTMLYRFHVSMRGHVEAAAQALAAPELALAHHARLAALQDDLETLSRPCPVSEPEAVADEAFSLGCLYTLQGSTLGGKVIYRQLDFLFADEKGRRFFRGTDQDGALWQRLCAGLEEFATDYPLLEDGAAHAFARFASQLDR